ncbi:Acyl-coenzyme A thioesterase 13 [Glycine soja]|uniref:Acyl-coenzyme A thioesterase 13 n=1 Tax=Glycine soja TaxID=3848 RepID=A0A0B2P4T2_GLYSO|nr:hypothetical protein JHK86_017342 [Glycine max]KHN04220.1 Acyl-coenzyme A thioesterase 13 [Glycine soja]
MVEKEMEDPSLEVIRKWIKGLSDGTYGQEFTSTTRVIRLVKAHKGFILCDLIIHSGLLDENGNWHVSAIATLVDIIASFTSYSVTSCLQVTLDLSISYYSTAKLQAEEVEVEAKVIRKKDELISVIVEVRKKHNGELVALGKLWMVARKNPRK